MNDLQQQSHDLLQNAHLLLEDFFTTLNLKQQYSITTIFHRAILLSEILMETPDLEHHPDKHMIIHRLNNLLTPILGYGHLLKLPQLGTLAPQQTTNLECILLLAESLRSGLKCVAQEENYDTAHAS